MTRTKEFLLTLPIILLTFAYVFAWIPFAAFCWAMGAPYLDTFIEKLSEAAIFLWPIPILVSLWWLLVRFLRYHERLKFVQLQARQ
jgi:hypothetical protein